jgi:hypothetical protein
MIEHASTTAISRKRDRRFSILGSMATVLATSGLPILRLLCSRPASTRVRSAFDPALRLHLGDGLFAGAQFVAGCTDSGAHALQRGSLHRMRNMALPRRHCLSPLIRRATPGREAVSPKARFILREGSGPTHLSAGMRCIGPTEPG